MFLQMQRDVAVGNKSDLGGGGGGGGRRRMGKRRKGGRPGRAIEKKAPRSFAYGGGRQVGWAVVEGEGDKTKGFFKREEKERDCALFELVPANSIYADFFVIPGARHSACTIPTWPLFGGRPTWA